MNTSNLAHKIATADVQGRFIGTISMFSQQMLHRIPVFSCGLFTFDLGLAFKVNKYK